MAKRKKIDVSLGSLYLHAADGGLTLEVKDVGFGPTLEVTAGSFGNPITTIKTHLRKDTLEDLAMFFRKMAESAYSFSEEYCYAAGALKGTSSGSTSVPEFGEAHSEGAEEDRPKSKGHWESHPENKNVSSQRSPPAIWVDDEET